MRKSIEMLMKFTLRWFGFGFVFGFGFSFQA